MLIMDSSDEDAVAGLIFLAYMLEIEKRELSNFLAELLPMN